jgi:DNA primase
LVAEANLEDAKEKARIVEQMLPLLRDVADPVEREVYTQKIARTLHIEERTVLGRLHRAERMSARSQPDHARARRHPSADLEGYCLTGLFRRPWLLQRANETLEEMTLSPLQAQDFSDPVYRALFEAWEALPRKETPSLGQLRDDLPPVAVDRLESLLAASEDLSDDQWTREAVSAALRLRQRHLKQMEAEFRALTREAEEEGLSEAVEHGETCLDYARAILQIQHALSRRQASGT